MTETRPPLILSCSLLAASRARCSRSPLRLPAQASAHDRLFQVFKDSDEAIAQAQPAASAAPRRLSLRRPARRPVQRRAFRGREGRGRARPCRASRDPARPAQRRATSSPMTCSSFRPRTRCAATAATYCALNEALPMNHFFGIHTEYPTIASGQGGAPYTTRRRLREQPEAQPRLRGQHRRGDPRSGSKGEAEGVVDTKLTVRNMIEQLDSQLKLKPEESPYWGPIKDIPESCRARRPRAADG